MPFHVLEIIFFVCPVCKSEHTLGEAPARGEVIQCQAESCKGQEAFSDFISSQKTSHDPSYPVCTEARLTFPASPKATKSTGEIKKKQPLVILVGSAVLISTGLIVTWILLFYLVPLILSRCMAG